MPGALARSACTKRLSERACLLSTNGRDDRERFAGLDADVMHAFVRIRDLRVADRLIPEQVARSSAADVLDHEARFVVVHVQRETAFFTSQIHVVSVSRGRLARDSRR